jgi:hypothetical protein
MIRRLLLALAAFVALAGAVAAQTVPPTFFGQNVALPTINWPAYYANNVRFWVAQVSGANINRWSSQNPSNGTYSFTGFNSAMTTAASKNTPVEITLGSVPSWVNSVQALTTPTQQGYLYTFVQQLFADLQSNATPIGYISLWNEFNYGVGGWVGTDAQMTTISQNLYPIVKTASPNTVVLSPSITPVADNSGNQIPISGWYHWQQYLLGCAAGPTCFDVANIHGYAATLLNSAVPSYIRNAPEQVLNNIINARAVMTATGYGSYPLYIDEGYWGVTPGDLTTSFDTDLLAGISTRGILQIASSGVPFFDYEAYGTGCVNQSACGTSYGTNGTGMNRNGAAIRVVYSELAGATFTSPMTRQAGTNQIRQAPNDPSAAIGLVSGPGGCTGAPSGTGSVPSDWHVSNPHSGAGESVYVVADGTDSTGVPYIRVRVCGTDTTSGSGAEPVSISFETTTGISASLSQSWDFAVSVNAPGSIAGLEEVSLGYNEYDSGGTNLDGGGYYMVFPVNVGLSAQRYQYREPMTGTTTAYVRPNIQVYYYYNNSALANDITIDIGNPTADQGNDQWTGTITKSYQAGYQGEFAYDASGGPSSFTVPTGMTWMRDMYGDVSPVTAGNSVTLGLGPVLFENSQTKGFMGSL